MSLDPELVRILQCPDCGGDISYWKHPEKLQCKKCKRIFKIKDGIPVMLPKKS